MQTSIRARWILPINEEPIRDGVIRVEDDRIVAVGRGRAGENVQDLGSVAVLPGLVNAHAHLELSGIDAPLGRPGIPIVDWIKLVVDTRQARNHDPDAAVRRGLQECTDWGVAAVGDIVQPSSHPPDVPMVLSRFLELIGPTESRAAEALQIAASYVRAGQGRAAQRIGLSPHAPYSVRRELVEEACHLSRDHCIPVAFHLAESREEMQLLRNGTGPFRELLHRLDAWDPSAQHRGRRPLDFLELLAAADRALVIHGNYLDDEEISFLAERRERMSVVYCPRTHAWFRHDPYPLKEMLEAGVTVALGTDSRASSPDLNLLEEILAAAKRHPDVPREKIIEMGTLSGAKALGCDDQLGTLEPGKLARLAVVDLPPEETDDPYQLLFGVTGK